LADIVRRRKPSPVEFALTPSLGEVSRAHLQEVHDNLGNLAARLEELRDQLMALIDALRDDVTGLRALLETLRDEVLGLIEQLRDECEACECTGSGNVRIYIVATYADLPNPAGVGDGALGYTKDKDNFYGVRAGAWRIMHPFVQTTAPSSIGEANGDLWYDTDTSPYQMSALCNGTWYGIVWSE